MPYTLTLLFAAVLFVLYLLATNQDPGTACGLNNFERAAELIAP